jgi:uncharacterized protein (DUF433 family)
VETASFVSGVMSMTRHEPAIVRTGRGLVLKGTGITLYSIMDYVGAGDPPERIRDSLALTDAQVAVALAYIDAHRAEVDAEYQQVLRNAEENRRYWEERNRQRLAQIAANPNPAFAALRAEVEARRAMRDAQE